MDRTWKPVLWQQFGAAIDMLENAMLACPDELWNRPSRQMGFWYLVYHTLLYLDYDLSPSEQEFIPSPFDIYSYELTGQEPPFERPYTKSDLKDYLQHCREKCRETIEAFEKHRRNERGFLSLADPRMMGRE